MGMSLPRHHRLRTCFDNSRKSIHRRYGRELWDAHSCRRRGICRRICRKDDRLLCQVVYGTLLDRWALLDPNFVGNGRDIYLRMMTRHDAVPSGCRLEALGVCGIGITGGKNEKGSFKCEESDIFMPRFVSPVKLSKLGLDPPTCPIIYRPVMKLSY